MDEYDPEMMTYSAEDEVLPSLSDAKAAHEVARAIARGDDVGAPVGQAAAAEQGASKKGKVSCCACLFLARCRTGACSRTFALMQESWHCGFRTETSHPLLACNSTH